jgi:hypothetical protein
MLVRQSTLPWLAIGLAVFGEDLDVVTRALLCEAWVWLKAAAAVVVEALPAFFFFAAEAAEEEEDFLLDDEDEDVFLVL